MSMRRSVLEAQHVSIGEEMPFTLESALHFRRVKILHDRGVLPEVDTAIQYPEGIRIREIDAVISEPFQVALARLFPDSVPFASRIRWIEAGWFSLAMPLLMVAVRVWTGSWWGGFFAALLYAVGLASVLRSTGQEISRENFALPWLVASVAAAAGYLRPQPGLSRMVWGVLFAALFAMALMGWDMIQYVIALATLGVSAHVIAHCDQSDRTIRGLFIWLFAAVFLVAVLHPYYHFHGLAFSPLMIWMAGVLGGWWYLQHTTNRVADPSQNTSAVPPRRLMLAAIIVGPLVVVMLFGLTGAYGASYEHFAQLIFAKIRFLNDKPADPGLLTFYQRIMWVPSLHSATWGLTTWLFPFIVWVVLLIAPVAWLSARKSPDPLLRFILLFFLTSLGAYILLVRFHVFVALAIAMVAGWSYARAGTRAGVAGRAAMGLLLAFAVMAEANHTLRERHRMGRPNVYYDELRDLASWLREHAAPEPVLANMGVSAYVAAYGKCSIAIHPKFEDPFIRRRLERYASIMFGEDEQTLRDFMDELGITLLVYARGEFAEEKPEYQMRYFVNKMDPPDHVPARRFEREDDSLRYFTRLWGNRKYTVYRALSGTREQQARQLAEQAWESLEVGLLDGAERLATEALLVDRHQDRALRVMRHVGSLREQGFAEPATGGRP
ncbi:MAG TPA: hypothetical protein PKA21_05090 [Kiritimatiellia bacterium]|nr:hypothetical protein [Kiritimatiellia bacterium]